MEKTKKEETTKNETTPSFKPNEVNEIESEDVEKSEDTTESKEGTLRYLPKNKKPDAALTFPEKMMSLMKFAAKSGDPETYCVAWLPDGKSFVIRDPDGFTRKVLPKFFKATKFSSFTRKLYRWGFRQVNRGIGPDDPIIFGNEYFQRDNAELMTKMRSTTAASTRKQEEDNLQTMLAQKRALDSREADREQKRMLLSTLMQQNMMQQNFGNFPPQNTVQNFQPNQFLMQSLQQQQQQQQSQGMFGSNNSGSQNMQLMNAFGNGNFSTSNSNGGVGGLKPFDLLAAQQQQYNQVNVSNNAPNFNPLLNFQLPTSNNNGLGINNNNNNMSNLANVNMMNMSTSSMTGSLNNLPNNANNMMGLGGTGGAMSNQNPSTTVQIVNAAINALKHAP